MKWNELTSLNQIGQIIDQSNEKPVLIFKYSSRCSVSRLALDRLERKWDDTEMSHITPYFLDLITYREVSNRIADQFDVEHESPQVLLIDKGKSILDQSHMAIDYSAIKEASGS